MIDWDLMILAAKAAEQTVFEDNRLHPRVGALLANRERGVLLTAFRGQCGCGDHAEYLLLERARDTHLRLCDCVLYTTLEPCTSRGHPKIPCAVRIANSGIKRVAIGLVDPNPRMRGLGIHQLQSSGVEVFLAPPKIYNKIAVLNADFISQFATSA
jgi:pyrimidine deaminase RibD-like protein